MKYKYKLLLLFLISLGVAYSILINVNGNQNLLDSKELIIIGHRGASAIAPEHTLLSYDIAIEKGADYLELDLQQTKDKELIVMHDSKIDRTTNSEGYVKEHTLSQMKKLDAGSWFNEMNPEKANADYTQMTVPTLKEVIDRYGDSINYYIEIKSSGIEKELLLQLQRHGLLSKSQPVGKVVIQSFNEESLKTIKELNSSIPLIQLQWFEHQATITRTEIEEIRKYAVGIGVNYTSLHKEYIQKLKSSNLLVHTYTVNNKIDYEKLKEAGVNGIFTDNLEIAFKNERE